MSTPFVFRRPVAFDEVDAAGYVFYPKVIALAHEAMDRMLSDALPGGYARFVVDARIGLPCVHVEADFIGPLRYGDDVEVEAAVTKFGTTSVAFDVQVRNARGAACARLTYVVACADLDGPKSRPLPDELRAALARHAR